MFPSNPITLSTKEICGDRSTKIYYSRSVYNLRWYLSSLTRFSHVPKTIPQDSIDTDRFSRPTVDLNGPKFFCGVSSASLGQRVESTGNGKLDAVARPRNVAHKSCPRRLRSAGTNGFPKLSFAESRATAADFTTSVYVPREKSLSYLRRPTRVLGTWRKPGTMRRGTYATRASTFDGDQKGRASLSFFHAGAEKTR